MHTLSFSLVADTDLEMFTFTEFGKNFPKSIKLSPDGFIQNAIQLAYYKLVHMCMLSIVTVVICQETVV